MAGILGLASQQGSLAQGISDDSLEQNTDRDVRNRAIKEENKDAAWNIAGRATAAGITAAKTSTDFKGFVDNFKKDFINPSSKYVNLRRALKGKDPVVSAPVPTTGAPVDNAPDIVQASNVNTPQRGPHSSINNENADVNGAIINNMIGGRWSGGA